MTAKGRGGEGWGMEGLSKGGEKRELMDSSVVTAGVGVGGDGRGYRGHKQ